MNQTVPARDRLAMYDRLNYDLSLQESLEACLQHPKGATFERGLQTLQNIAGNCNGQVRLYPDWPAAKQQPVVDYGWDITRVHEGQTKCVMNGGLLYHGSHDSFGSGSAPTFAVTLSPTDGWSVHT